MPSAQHEAVVQFLRDKPLDSNLSFVEQRRYYDEVVGGLPLADGVTLEDHVIAGREADLLWAEGADKSRVILHFHGGGYAIGSNRMYRDFATRLSRATRMAVLVPHYRLAPEDPFPAAVEDAMASYKWLLDRGFAPGKIAIAGDSAGGGLAAAALMSLRDEALPMPAAAAFISPWTDLELTGEGFVPGAIDDPAMDARNLANMAHAYAGEDLRNPLVSPLHGSVRDFPPSIVFVGTRELVVGDGRRLTAALKNAEIEVEHVEGEGLIHCWSVVAPDAPESIKCLEDIGQFLSRHIL
jgi:monoterpene epsilon-lactone hydrolase